ncbi:MAG: SDR family oxidoreductase [Candidatus Moraniibacteriota bacterium]
MDKHQYIPKVVGHALVLGGSGGIGSEIVKALVANGASAVTFTYNSNREKAEALKAEIEVEGVKVYIAQLTERTDETEGAFKSFLEEAVAAVGQEITVAVDTIGISPNVSHLDQTLNAVEKDSEGHRRVYEVNVFGAFISTRAILERMKAKGVKGSMIVITSTNGINSYASISMPYDGSKAALVPYMRSWSEEYAPFGIRVNGVAPGWIDTAMNKTLPTAYREKEMAKIGLGRFAEPHEVASVVAFLSGTGAEYIHGQNIMVDGYYR